MRTPFTMHTTLQRALRPLRWLPPLCLALTAVACAENVEVGEAKPDDGEAAEEPQTSGDEQDPDDGIEEPDAPVDEPDAPVDEPDATSEEPEAVDCSEADAAARAPYDAWQEIENDFGVLAGKTLSGYIEGGPDLSLVIATDHSATLTVGAAAPAPQKNQSYLCDNGFEDEHVACEVAASHPPVQGGSYPVHGAALEDSRLKMPVQPFSPWDAWCALQDPYEQEQPDRCFFTTSSGAGFSTSLESCSLDDEQVDCGWLALVQSGICSCTSTECFAAMAGEGELIDARLNETEDTLTGSFLGATVYLFVDEE